ncbi:MAG: hypothetical protein AB1896_15655, partial [Thermodesulfobacteriota bacterium]
MSGPSLEEIRRVVREVLEETLGRDRSGAGSRKPPADGPRALIVYHGGTARLDEAQAQVEKIGALCFKSGVHTTPLA